MAAQCIVSFGSNLGNRDRLIASAARLIAGSSLLSSTLRTSRLFETPAIGGPGGQEPFLNAIGAFETNASAREILELLQQTEHDLGRHRRRRWDARSIDLDVVLHGELVGGGSGLIVPHPRYTARQFVLQPACDVAAHFRDPRFGWSLRRLADHVSAGLPSLALVGGELQTRQEICERLAGEHGIQTFAANPASPSVSIVANAPAAPTNRAANRWRRGGPGGSDPGDRSSLGGRVSAAAAGFGWRPDRSAPCPAVDRAIATDDGPDLLAGAASNVAQWVALARIPAGNRRSRVGDQGSRIGARFDAMSCSRRHRGWKLVDVRPLSQTG